MFENKIVYSELKNPLAINVPLSSRCYFPTPNKQKPTCYRMTRAVMANLTSACTFLEWIMWNDNRFSAVSVIQYSCGLQMTLYQQNSKLGFFIFFLSMNWYTKWLLITKGFNIIRVWVDVPAGSIFILGIERISSTSNLIMEIVFFAGRETKTAHIYTLVRTHTQHRLTFFIFI